MPRWSGWVRVSETSSANSVSRGSLGCAWSAVIVALVAWGGLSFIGYSLWESTKIRVSDSPYLPGQWRYYVGVPLLVTLTVAVMAAALLRWRRLATIAANVGTILILALLPYLLPYTGGV